MELFFHQENKKFRLPLFLVSHCRCVSPVSEFCLQESRTYFDDPVTIRTRNGLLFSFVVCSQFFFQHTSQSIIGHHIDASLTFAFTTKMKLKLQRKSPLYLPYLSQRLALQSVRAVGRVTLCLTVNAICQCGFRRNIDCSPNRVSNHCFLIIVLLFPCSLESTAMHDFYKKVWTPSP